MAIVHTHRFLHNQTYKERENQIRNVQSEGNQKKENKTNREQISW
jgi:hypothetical protein